MSTKKKTVKSVKKRFKLTATGKVKRRQAGAGHLLSKKNADKRRSLRKSKVLIKGDADRVKKVLCD